MAACPRRRTCGPGQIMIGRINRLGEIKPFAADTGKEGDANKQRSTTAVRLGRLVDFAIIAVPPRPARPWPT